MRTIAAMSHIEIRASTSYDGPFTKVPVNTDKPIELENDVCSIKVVVRIKGFKQDGKLVDTDYFKDSRAGDSFSVQFSLKFKQDVNGNELLWGNDFDSPIRDILPWGFSAAFATFKRMIDPSVDGDVYADKPYIYGPCLTSINYFVPQDDHKIVTPLVETGNTTRQKKYLDEKLRKDFVFKAGEVYDFDFVTPYLDMSEKWAIKLPFFTFDLGKYAGKTTVRYSLKRDKDLVFCLVFDVIDGGAATEGATNGDATAEDAATEDAGVKNADIKAGSDKPTDASEKDVSAGSSTSEPDASSTKTTTESSAVDASSKSTAGNSSNDDSAIAVKKDEQPDKVKESLAKQGSSTSTKDASVDPAKHTSEKDASA